jgi:putative thioredoxin
MGALPESQVNAFIERVAGPAESSDIDQALQAAAELFEQQDYAGAASLYAAVLQAEPDNMAALSGLVRAQIALGSLDQARGLLASLSPEQQKDPAIAGARAALDLAEQAEKLGQPSDLEDRIHADPDDHQARYDLAVALNAQGDRQAAADQLLEIIRRDRSWNDEAARKQLVQFFDAWGFKDPAAVKGRQRLSSLLFA